MPSLTTWKIFTFEQPLQQAFVLSGSPSILNKFAFLFIHLLVPFATVASLEVRFCQASEVRPGRTNPVIALTVETLKLAIYLILDC
jgi:hypothetical protein